MISSLMIRNKVEADYITSGKCNPGDKLPTIRYLAQEYGVSYVTVLESVRILAQEGRVVKKQGSGVYVSSALLKERSAIKKIGYITNSFALKDGYGYKILDGIEKIASCRGYSLELANSNQDIEKEKKAVARFAEAGVAGIVLYPVLDRDPNNEYLANSFTDIPIVLVDLAKPEMQRSSVIFDNCAAGYEMVKYLIGKNKKRIVFMHNFLLSDVRSVQDRISGCRSAVEDEISAGNDVEFSVKTWMGDDFEYLNRELETFLGSNNHPNAVISCYDAEAAVVYFWLKANGFKVPSEIEVVGFDNIMPDFMPWHDLSDGYQYHWPTTNPDFMKLGQRAFELLLDLMKTNSSVHREIVLPCPVIMKRNNYKKNIAGISIKSIS